MSKLWTPSRRKLLLGGASLIAFPAILLAQVPMTGAGLAKPSSGAAYTGLCDTSVSGSNCNRYWGLRAASAATRGNNAASICDTATLFTCSDVATDATTGKISVSTISALPQCAISCSVRTLYEQMGTGDDMISGGAGSAPVWNTSAGPSAGFSAGVFTSSNSQRLFGTSVSIIAQPITISTTYKKTLSSTNYSMLFSSDSGNFWIGATSATTLNTAGANLGTTERNATASDSTWHNLTVLAKTSNVTLCVDGSCGSAQASGSHGLASQNVIGADGGALFLDANFEELAIWSSDVSANASSISSNAHTNFGF